MVRLPDPWRFSLSASSLPENPLPTPSAGVRISGTERGPRGSSDAVAQGRLYGGAGVEGTEHLDRGDRGAGQLGRDVLGDTGQPQHPNIERLPGGLRGFQIVPAVVAQAEFDALASNGLLGCVRMPLDLVANGGADEVGAIGVEPLLHQEIDMPEIDITEVDRDLLGIAGLGAEFVDIVGHRTIL